jgi:hypothetical protein
MQSYLNAYKPRQVVNSSFSGELRAEQSVRFKSPLRTNKRIINHLLTPCHSCSAVVLNNSKSGIARKGARSGAVLWRKLRCAEKQMQPFAEDFAHLDHTIRTQVKAIGKIFRVAVEGCVLRVGEVN